MYLGPHHFQLQSRYFESAIQFTASSLWFAAYGVAGLELDTEALQNGTVVLLHARGILPDGLAFNMPETDDLPAPRSIADVFPPTVDSATLLLAIPERRPNGLNCALEAAAASDSHGPRYLAEPRLMHDENTGGDERSVRFARKNLRLVLDSEPVRDLITLPIARIVRDGSGRFSYDSRFIPPVLQISASEWLVALVRRTLDLLDQRIASIVDVHRSPTAGLSTREIANFWLLHAVNSAMAPLRHLVSSKRGHPEELFSELSRLAGALCTFKLGSHPRELTSYDHDRLSECFGALEAHIRDHLEVIVPNNCISIPLTLSGDYFLDGEIVDQRCLSRSQWVLALRASMGEVELLTKAPQLVKICSSDFVRQLVKRALPGLALNHLSVLPPAISTTVETQYFSISRVGPCWEHMVKTKRVGVYIPGDIPHPEAEILVVLDQS
jgi:type VI secretion system protein ImpJ